MMQEKNNEEIFIGYSSTNIYKKTIEEKLKEYFYGLFDWWGKIKL